MTKIIKEMLPPDVRVARDTQDLLIECCVGEILIFKKKKVKTHEIAMYFHLFLYYSIQSKML